MIVRSLLAGLLLISAALGYVRSTTSSVTVDAPLRWPNPAAVRFAANNTIAAGMLNSAGQPMISAASDPVAALQAALDSWTRISSSAIDLGQLGSTASFGNGSDRVNTFVLADTPQIHAITGDALAQTIVTFFPDGSVIDADIYFNPSPQISGQHAPFATDGDSSAFDLQTVAAHEVGHALGAGHSGVLTALMYHSIGGGTRIKRNPAVDDQAFARDAYPEAATPSEFAALTGQIQFPDGRPVRAAHVGVLDPQSGLIVGNYSSIRNGSFRIAGVPPGSYLIFAEPLDGPVRPATINLRDDQADTAFGTVINGGAANPILLTLSAGQTTNANFSVVASAPAFNIRRFGLGSANGAGDHFGMATWTLPLRQGEVIDVLLQMDNLASSNGVDVRIYGPGLSLRSNSIRIDPTGFLRFTVQVAADTPGGSGSIAVSRSAEAVLAGGVLAVQGSPGPVFTRGSLVNAASFATTNPSPGSIFSLFGTSLSVGTAQADRLPLPTQLAGGRVRLLDAAGSLSDAPLFFASPGQLNLLIPTRTATGPATLTVIREDGTQTLIGITITPVSPGLFSANASAKDVAAAQYIELENGVQSPPRFAFRYDAAIQKQVPVPIPVPSSGKQIYLSLYGTGIRGFVNAATATVGGLAVPVIAVAASPEFEGLDQIAIGPLPPSLTGKGEVAIGLTIDGQAANPVTVSIR